MSLLNSLLSPASGAALSNALTSGNIFVGNSSNQAAGVAVTGDISITNAGVATVNTIGGNTPAVLNLTQTYTKAQRGAFSALTDASTVAIDLSLANNYNLTLGGNRTLGIPTNMRAGQSGVISVHQDVTGSRTLAYGWPYQFPSGTAPILSTGALSFDQLNYMVNSYGASPVTVTIATPAVMTWTGHGLVSGQRIQLATTGALPTGLAVATTYWVTVIDANTFNLSSSFANAQSATFIATSGSQSGTHTATNASISLTANLAMA